MNDLLALLHREAVYLWYYFTVQLEQILGWWVLGMLVGSAGCGTIGSPPS